MDHFIKNIEIKNFKSVRELNLSGFKRINLFIGRPNVGKSNLFEALSLFGVLYIWKGSKNIYDLIRLKNIREIFYEGQVNNAIGIGIKRAKSDLDYESLHLKFHKESNNLSIELERVNFRVDSNSKTSKSTIGRLYITVDSKLKLKNLSVRNRMEVVHDGAKFTPTDIKFYRHNSNTDFKEYDTSFLYPPFGNNLLYTLQLMPELRQLYASWFKAYGLRMVLDTVSQSLKIQRDKGDEVFQLPYSSVADTLQRIIFYKTAVASNENSVLLFEEPEAHAYPPYIAEFTHEVIKSKTNQTFIITHSPLIVEQFLSDALDDLAIFMVDFKDGQTVVKGLSAEEVNEVYRYGMDLFFNGEAYLD